MISAKEARSLMLANASFERKVELYNQVTKIINEAVEGKKNTFDISEEQHLVLNKELLEKGYQETNQSVPAIFSFRVSSDGCFTNPSPMHTYKI